MASLFLSYRRSDSPDTVKLIHERLQQRLRGWDIFYDHQSIPQGEEFPELLRAKVTAATAVLVIIGPRWLDLLRQRQGADTDHVRAEVRLALEAGKNVIPVLVGMAEMPAAADLAAFPDLQPLLQRNGRTIRPEPSFDADLERLIAGLEQSGPGEALGTVLAGKYKLTALLGEGGMGIVYLAQQTQPVKRDVALKLIKPGMDSKEILARFDAERQALALMNHPHIARVLDAGTAPSGRPFFVMEYVKGVPITQYCDAKKLATEERLELCTLVCHAVQHAHQKGIIHRDLKPSNVLVEEVDGKPVPKVIDFGLAKALGSRLTEQTLHTAFETRVGTLEYSSPEQAAGHTFDIDTRTDIYSLGVLLYELLTGTPPFSREQLLKIGEAEMCRVIREQDPPKPSTKLSSSGDLPTIAAKRKLEPNRLSRLVRGDLDWIVMKCLEKDRDRRYRSADQLGEELQRFLADEPVQAGPPSAGYRMKKFLRRNKGTVSAAALVLLALVAGIIGTSIGLVQAEWARGEEAKQRERAEESEGKAKLATQKAIDAAEVNKELARVADERRRVAEKLALQARFDYYYFRSREEPALAMVGSAQLLAEALRLQDRSLGDSILLHLGDWSQEVHRLRGVCSHQYQARLWEAATGKPLGPVLKHQSYVWAVAFSPDGKTVLTGSEDNMARLWEVATGKQLGPVLQHQEAVGAVAFSSDGRTVLTGSAGTARLWDVATGKQLGSALQHSGEIRAVAFSPDGKFVLTGSFALTVGGDTATLWEVATGKQLGPVLQHQGPVEAVAFSPDSKTVLTGSQDKTARLWDVATGKQLGGPALQHQDWVSAVAFSPNGKSVLTGSRDKTAQLWDVATGKQLGPVLQHQEAVGAVAFSSDGRTVLTGSAGTARLWDVATGKQLGSALQHLGEIRAVAFSPDGRTLLTIATDGQSELDRILITVRQWETATGRQLGPTLEHRAEIYVVAFSSDGKTVLTGSRGWSRLWEVTTGKQLGPTLRHPAKGVPMAFSPDGKTMLTGSRGHQAFLWEVATDKQLGPALQHQDSVGAVAFSPDGKTVLTGSKDKTARLWDVATGKQLGPALQHQDWVWAVAISPNGKSVLTGSRDKTARLWDVATGKQLGPVLQHQDEVEAVAFSPDSKTLLTGSRDRTARLWEAATGKQFTRALQHHGPVKAVAFHPDGKIVLTGSSD